MFESIFQQKIKQKNKKRNIRESKKSINYPEVIHLFKVSNRNTSIICQTCPKLTLKTPE